MKINDAIRLTTDACELKHLSLSTWKTYTHWINRYALFLKGLSLTTQSTPVFFGIYQLTNGSRVVRFCYVW